MSIFGNWFGRIKGGWRTVGAPGANFFNASDDDWVATPVGPISAMKLSAYYACDRLLSETMGSMSFQVIDNANNIVKDHDLYGLMRQPNADQTSDAFVAAMTVNKSSFGNSMAHIKRFNTGVAYALDFYTTEMWDVSCDGQGRPRFAINGETVPNEDVLHWPAMSLNGYWGMPGLMASQEVLSMQRESNRSAARTFASGLRAGGFFTIPENKQAFTDAQLEKWKTELNKFAQPQNTSKWLPLLPGMGAVANTGYRIDPVTAELLQSRYFGIEEICRFKGVPPPLIGHTDKASSWASSLNELNQFLVTYTMMPQAVRLENEIARKLLGRNERNRLRPMFNMDSLLRGDIVKRFETYKIGREQGIYSPNDCRAKEKMPSREGGDDYAPSTKPTAAAVPTTKEPA
jgi:HK97 family phage portal protein